jgi:O-antigen ligase
LTRDVPLSAESRSTLETWVERFVVVALAACFLTVFDRGGNTDEAILFAACALLVSAVPTIWLLFAQRQEFTRSQTFFLLALGLLVLFGALGCVTLPLDVWVSLPGRARYTAVVETLSHPTLALSAIPVSFGANGGMRSLLIALCCLMIALATTAVGSRARSTLIYVLCAIATLQATIGFAQVALRGASIVTLDYVGHVRAAGTFVNKNHFATLIAMILPICINFTMRSRAEDTGRRDRQRVKTLLWGALTFALFSAVVASLSRSGIATAVVVTALSLGYEGARIKRRRGSKYLVVSASVAVAVACLALLATSESLFKAISDPSALGSFGARMKMYEATVIGLMNFFPLGAGLGGFATAFPAFQPAELTGYVEHAHNDYLQLLFESGLVGALFLALVAFAAITLVKKSKSVREESSHGVAYLIGATALAVHALTDFPTHIPALAFIGTFLFSAACAEMRPTTYVTSASDSLSRRRVA